MERNRFLGRDKAVESSVGNRGFGLSKHVRGILESKYEEKLRQRWGRTGQSLGPHRGLSYDYLEPSSIFSHQIQRPSRNHRSFRDRGRIGDSGSSKTAVRRARLCRTGTTTPLRTVLPFRLLLLSSSLLRSRNLLFQVKKTPLNTVLEGQNRHFKPSPSPA